MRKIGLIGGISVEGSSVCSRQINEAVRSKLGELHSAELLMHSVDFQDIVDMQESNRWDDAGRRLAEVGRALEGAGAECVLICAVTIHLVADAVEAAINVPFIHVSDETAKRLQATGGKRSLLIATRYPMENGFYQKRMKRHDIEVVVPDADSDRQVHKIIFDELCIGKVLDSSRDMLTNLVEKAKADGVDSVIFGCTEICLTLETDKLSLPGFDSTAIHSEAAMKFAPGNHI